METPMNEDDLDPRLRDWVRDYHLPPDPPREALWARITAARAADRTVPSPPRPLTTVLRRMRRPPLAVLVPTGVAALLALAFGLGRLSVRPAAPVAAHPASSPNLAVQVARADYLGRVEAFLTEFRAGAGSGRPDAAAPVDARRLLSATRLMLDSPGGQDPRIRPLLEDLELVLAEISQLPAASPAGVDLITEGLDRRGTLARLRYAVPAGSMPALQGEI